MTNPNTLTNGYNQDPYQYAQVMVERYENVLLSVAALADPERTVRLKEGSLVDIFPESTELRDHGLPPNWNADQTTKILAAVEPLGIGRESDLTIGALGLGYPVCAFIEGGQPHKIWAEVETMLVDAQDTVARIIVSASPYRNIVDIKEQASARRQLNTDVVPENEYAVARALVETVPGFHALEHDEVLPLSYALGGDLTVGDEPTGQFVRVGVINGQQDVVMFRVDREYYEEAGKRRYRQPGPTQVMTITSNALAKGTTADKKMSLAFVTSNTYLASRTVDGVLAGLATGRLIGVAAYGTKRLAAVKGEKQSVTPLNQIPGELRVVAHSVEELKYQLAQKRA